MTLTTLYNTTLRILVGIGGIFFFGDLAHDEFVRPSAERSLLALAGATIFVVLCAFIVPGLGLVVEDESGRAARLFSLGRRAYDGSLSPAKPSAVPPDIEVPPHA